MADVSAPPAGTVTFLFTDIEGSTRLWEQQTEAMRQVLAHHDALLAAIIEDHRGHVFKTVGDAFHAAFADARDAAEAAVEAQCALHRELPDVRVRMALHTGDAQARQGDYFGPTLNRVARLLEVGHGGQVLLSEATARLLQSSLPADTRLRLLGRHRLRGIAGTQAIDQLLPVGLPADFPPLNTLNVAFRRGVLRATLAFTLILAVIAGLALAAVTQARRAERLLYAADMSVAQQAWEVNDLGRGRELLEAHRPRPGYEDLRGFEWRFLWRLCQDQSLFTLHGHSGWLWSVAFSPDGKTLASGSDALTLWDLTTRKEIATLRGHKDEVGSVAFSPDGKTLATGSSDKTVKLWDVATRREQATLRGHKHWIPSLAFSPDGKTLATASEDTTVKLWDVATRREMATLTGHHRIVRSVVFSPDGALLATGSFDQTARLWDVATRREIATLPGTGNIVAFSPDGRTLATGGKPVRLWDVATRRERARLPDEAWWVAFSPDGKTLAATQGRTLKLWDVATRRKVASLNGHEDGIWCVAFSPDGKRLATGSHDDTVKLWSATPRRDGNTLGSPRAAVGSVAFSPDSKTLVSGVYGVPAFMEAGGDIKLWDVGARREIATLWHDPGNVRVAFSPDGGTLASGHEDGRIRLWDVTQSIRAGYPPPAGLGRREVATWRGHEKLIRSVAFSPDGKMLATGGEDLTIKLWDVGTRQERATFRGHTRSVYALAFSLDGRTLVSCADEPTVLTWDLATRRRQATLRGHKRGVACAAFSPDGRILATGGTDNTVRLWDLGRQQPIATLKGHTHWIRELAFSPDGRTLASGSWDRTVKLWNLLTRREMLTLRGHQGNIYAVAFSPDGSTLASGGRDGIRLWRAPSFAETDAPNAGRQTSP